MKDHKADYEDENVEVEKLTYAFFKTFNQFQKINEL